MTTDLSKNSFISGNLKSNGKFIISLDFELMWGIRDKRSKNEYEQNIINVHQIIPKLLTYFSNYQVKATFSTIGFLFFETKKELIAFIPDTKPKYSDPRLSPYIGYLETIGDDFKQDLFHYAPQLIQEIRKYPEHEIGTHTFSHYYCLEEGQTLNAFRADLESAILIAKKFNIQLTSLVFPRNQFNNDYLKVCSDLGIICYRGNENSWIYSAKSGKHETLFRRSIRLLDAFINLSGYNCYSDHYLRSKFPINIPSSRFLRPYNKKMSLLDGLRIHRIKSAMTYAAKNNLTYHLWWHPHNFGNNIEENFNVLEKILTHYRSLNRTYNFQSYTMSTLANKLINEKQ